MHDLNQTITFIGLLAQCKRIVVPQIQRDYAQGRSTAKEVRDSFLESLRKAFVGPEPLNLDFIYGSLEDTGDSSAQHFSPLDGQQRLTTLLLLHWYLAWKEGELEDFKARLWDGNHSRFTYKVRPSSAEFFDELVQYKPECLPIAGCRVRALFENQQWFFLDWRLDPTIQSALTMLEEIHKKISGSSVKLYTQLIDDKRPAITFQLLELKDFGLSDDLYIKMNSRGKPLTPFETFKARFEDHLEKIFLTEQRPINGKLWTMREYFGLRMDTQWTDLFWSYRPNYNQDSNNISPVFDYELMNLLWAVAQVSLSPSDDKFLDKTALLQNKMGIVSFTTLHDQGLLTREFTEQLIALLEAWSAGGGKLTRQLEQNPYFDEDDLFQKAIKAPGNLTYVDLLKFVAFASYLTCWKSDVNPAQLRAWMRLVSNLAVNANFDRMEVFKRCVTTLHKLLPESKSILSHLTQTHLDALTGFSSQQLQEELLKAKLLLAHSGWKSRIEEAEAHGYFQGQIEFLLEFSGLRAKSLELPVQDWSPVMHLELQAGFDSYLAKAVVMFDKNGLVEPVGVWQRALLSIGDYLEPSKFGNRSFGTNAATERGSWKYLLRAGDDDASRRRKHLKTLWDQMNASPEITLQLEQIIAGATDLEPWRALLVTSPEMMDYCKKQKIREEVPQKLYLLKGEKKTGEYAELFSYALHQKLLNGKAKLAPLALDNYQFATRSEYEPHVLLKLTYPNVSLDFRIEMNDGMFIIFIKRATLTLEPQIENLLKVAMAFTDSKEVVDDLKLSCSQERILDVLEELASNLDLLLKT